MFFKKVKNKWRRKNILAPHAILNVNAVITVPHHPKSMCALLWKYFSVYISRK